MNNKTKRRFGLLGKRLDYSFSKQFFEEKFQQENISASYENIEIDSYDSLQEWMKTEVFNYNGLNVTTPYKYDVLNLLDKVSLEAKEIGAVNTILVQNGRTKGFNTDAFGFHQSIKPFLKNTHERALILGTGGASKAVAYVLKNIGLTVGFLSRNPNPDKMIFGYDEANKIMVEHFKLIVNCTPLGTYPNSEEMPNFPIEYVGEEHLVIDLIYNPQETLFLKLARENGAETLNGSSMLKHQALKAWEIWNNV